MTVTARSPYRLSVLVGLLAAFVVSASAQDKPRAGRRGIKPDNAPKVGEIAPAFELATLDGKSKVSLDEARREKPVILIFGSYT